MPRGLDWPALEQKLLAVLERGPSTAPELQEALGISQPSFSRLVDRAGASIVAFGRARLRQYGLACTLGPLVGPTALFRIDEDGEVEEIGQLVPIAPDRLVADGPRIRPEVGRDLPWFLRDLRPSGFMASLVPGVALHGLPPDLGRWDAARLVAYAARLGWNLPGAHIIGETAVRDWVERRAAPPDRIDGEVAAEYARRARVVGAPGDPGAWVSGDHPKFLATRTGPDGPRPVIVKFSPPRRDRSSRRVADLLVAEHLALRSLADAGHLAAPSTLIEADERVFLEVERWDRTRSGGRRATVSLAHVADRFTSPARSRWSAATARLLSDDLIDEALHHQVRFREQFAEFVACPTVALGDLALQLADLRLVGAAPAYGVAPRSLAPVGGIVPAAMPHLMPPPAANRDVAHAAQEVALTFWTAVRDDERISDDLRLLARQRRAQLAQLRA